MRKVISLHCEDADNVDSRKTCDGEVERRIGFGPYPDGMTMAVGKGGEDGEEQGWSSRVGEGGKHFGYDWEVAGLRM